MKFSIIIPTYNRSDAIRRTVNSILNLNIKEEFEIIVINDFPENPIEKFEDPRVKINENEQNLGRSASRNKGAYISCSDVVFFIDDDIEVKENIFFNHLAKLEKGAEASFSNVINIRTDGRKSALNDFLNTRGAVKLPKNSQVKSNYFTTAFCCIRKDFFDKIGKFDENFEGYGWEDPELGLRIEENSGNIEFIKTDALIHYHDKSIDEWVSQLENSGNNLQYLIKKHPVFADRIKVTVLKSVFARFAFNNLFFRIGIIKAKVFGGLLWFWMYRYLFYGAVSRSLRK